MIFRSCGYFCELSWSLLPYNYPLPGSSCSGEQQCRIALCPPVWLMPTSPLSWGFRFSSVLTLSRVVLEQWGWRVLWEKYLSHVCGLWVADGGPIWPHAKTKTPCCSPRMFFPGREEGMLTLFGLCVSSMRLLGLDRGVVGARALRGHDVTRWSKGCVLSSRPSRPLCATTSFDTSILNQKQRKGRGGGS